MFYALFTFLSYIYTPPRLTQAREEAHMMYLFFFQPQPTFGPQFGPQPTPDCHRLRLFAGYMYALPQTLFSYTSDGLITLTWQSRTSYARHRPTYMHSPLPE
ncbi:hypothetical protein F4775DRAFT_256901 [Biscogniauxia sp. FL1348]|nr:hypothetical protein F4775DRAFT_256901 [Biscogniauxia sp. FL1348]